jgi:predicted nucleic acid-binding protein
MKQRAYIETSVVSYAVGRPARNLLIAGRQQLTRRWWSTAAERFTLLISPVVIRECAAGNAEMAALRLRAIAGLPSLELGESVVHLAEKLVHYGGLPQQAANDALHVAVAAVWRVDYLITWNCTHIANASTRRVMEQIVLASNLPLPVICTPEELP